MSISNMHRTQSPSPASSSNHKTRPRHLSVLSNTLALYPNHHGDPSDPYEGISLEAFHRDTPDSRSISSSQDSERHDDQHSTGLRQAAHRPGTVRLASILGPEQRQSPSPLHSHASSSKRKTINVILFGEHGSGKSSVLNAIAQNSAVQTSSNATASPFSYQRDEVTIASQRFALFDIAGLDEGTTSTALDKEKLKGLLCGLTTAGSEGIGLLVYCVRSTTHRRALIRNYDLFYSAICKEKVPIVVVVTGLDNERDMESWWTTNGKDFKSRDMHFQDHACVTTLHSYQGMPDALAYRIAASRKTLRELIVKNCSESPFDGIHIKATCVDVRNMIRNSESILRENGVGHHRWRWRSILDICSLWRRRR